MGVRGDLEPVLLPPGRVALVAARFPARGLRCFVENVAEALVEQQREDELLVVAGIDGAAQERGGAPQVRFQLRLGNARAHFLSNAGLKPPLVGRKYAVYLASSGDSLSR